MSDGAKNCKPIVVIAEDDSDDRLILKVAFTAAFEDECEIDFVKDGEELMDYLQHHGKYRELAPQRPALILLDLTMPRKGGREALLEIKENLNLKDIPLVVWTTSETEEDMDFSMKHGASAFFTKPCTFPELEATIRDVVRTWLRPPK